jgi:hypothetical protein
MNAHDRLEHQLRSSVARNADRRRTRSRHGLWSRGLSWLLLAVSCAVVLSVALFALVSLHHHRAQTPQPAPAATNDHRPPHSSAPPSPGPIPRNADDAVIAASFNTASKEDRACGPGAAGPFATISQGSPSATILSTLPILRRPATSADQLPSPRYFHGRLIGPFQGGVVYVRYVRLARVVDGISFYLVPVGNLGRPPISQTAADRCYRLMVAALRAQLPKVPTNNRAVTLRYGKSQFAEARWNLANSSVYQGVFLLYQLPDGGGSGSVVRASMIQQGGTLGGGGSASSGIMLDGIVPPDVATVTLNFPATRYRGHRLPPLSVTGNVVNDVLFIHPIPTLFQRGGWPTSAIWRSASGKVIKTINETPFHP